MRLSSKQLKPSTSMLLLRKADLAIMGNSTIHLLPSPYRQLRNMLHVLYSIQTAKIYADAGIPTKIILDNAVGAVMESVDMVLVGAEGVMENGGIVNKVAKYLTISYACSQMRLFSLDWYLSVSPSGGS